MVKDKLDFHADMDSDNTTQVPLTIKDNKQQKRSPLQKITKNSDTQGASAAIEVEQGEHITLVQPQFKFDKLKRELKNNIALQIGTKPGTGDYSFAEMEPTTIDLLTLSNVLRTAKLRNNPRWVDRLTWEVQYLIENGYGKQDIIIHPTYGDGQITNDDSSKQFFQ